VPFSTPMLHRSGASMGMYTGVQTALMIFIGGK